ncbi:MAG: O-antigen ligase family protein [bacterium]|nr:O-antigen ligase family protein [bacterium]
MAFGITIGITFVLFILFLWVPRKGFAVLLFLLPLSFALNPAPTIDLALLRLAVPVFWIALLIKYPRHFFAEARKPLSLAAGLFVAVTVLVTVFSQEPAWSARKLLYLASLVPLLPAAAMIFRQNDVPPEKQHHMFMWPLFAGGVLASFFGLAQVTAQFFVGTDRLFRFFVGLAPYLYGNDFGALVTEFPSWFVSIGDKDYLRAFASFPDPHMFAFYLEMLAAPALALALRTQDGRVAKRYVMLFVLFTAALLLTFSRGGYLGYFAGCIVTWIAAGKTYLITQRKAAAYGGLVMTLGVLVALLTPFAYQRLVSAFDVAEGSNAGRIAIWQNAIAVFERHPFGVGLGNYAAIGENAGGFRNAVTTHNLYLDLLVETGLAGLVAYLALMGLGLATFIRGALRDRTPAGALKAGFAGSLAAFSVHAIFEVPLYAPQIFVLLIILFGYASVARVSKA